MEKIYKNLSLENINGEIWEEIYGYNGDYFVSNLGRIKSLKSRKEKILRQKIGNGYLRINLSKSGKANSELIHVLMYESFIEKIQKGYFVHHKDFTKDNRLDNFQLITISEHNSLHHKGEKHYLYGRNIPEKTKQLMRENHADFKGENHPKSILTEQDIIKMKSLWDNNIKISNKLLSKWYKVNPGTISKIKTGKTWRDTN